MIIIMSGSVENGEKILNFNGSASEMYINIT